MTLKVPKFFPISLLLAIFFLVNGPKKGGSCDVSSWDAFYLALFWALNSVAWFLFNFHWHQLILYSVSSTTALSSNNLSNISSNISSASILNGWFRDYLWFNLSSLIRGYDLFGSNDLGIWAWTFLLAHLCWAVSFMFLISWRSYWQELIDSVIYLFTSRPFSYLYPGPLPFPPRSHYLLCRNDLSAQVIFPLAIS